MVKIVFINKKQKAEYLLDDMKSYHYLSNPYVPIQGVDEVEEYNNTIKSMHIMGMNNDDIISIVRTVSGVLQMGNLSFKQERQSDQATLLICATVLLDYTVILSHKKSAIYSI